MRISFTAQGSFERTFASLTKMERLDFTAALQKYGRMGVSALASATPVESGVTAASWGFSVQGSRTSPSISWTNTHKVSGAPIVIMLQYGHGTGTGGYVQGRDFINPAIRPVFDKISNEVWKLVTSA